MNTNMIDRLCTSCGLCCDGTIFDDVELTGNDEADSLELLGLNIGTDDEVSLLQPCSAISGTRCRVYQHRPDCCADFECRLLQDARSGVISVEGAQCAISRTLEAAERIRELCTKIDPCDGTLALKERYYETLSSSTAMNDDIVEELTGLMDGLAGLIKEFFLD